VTPSFSGSLASVDGAITLASAATIPAADDGLLRGDGVFEVIRVYDGRPFALEEHVRRLERSALNLRLPVDLEAVRSDAHRLLAHAGSGPDHELLRIVITRGGRRVLLTESLPAMPEFIRLATITYSPTRVLDGVKSLSYASNMLTRRMARERGCDDALLVTPHGRVLEAPTSSIFWITDGAVITPPLNDHILASITRRVVIDETGALERPSALDELLGADEAFLASTVREVHPIAAIDDRSFTAPGAKTTEIAAAVGERIQSELAAAR
jgi:branched-chain amino acid aminotransferase